MIDHLVNWNLNNYSCVLLKLVSGEEIISHVDMKLYNKKKESSLVLYDPYMIVLDKSSIIMCLWVLGSMDNEYVIDKSDIMIRSIPMQKYQETYVRLIKEKYSNNFGEDDDDEILSSYGHKIIVDGTETLN